MGRKLVHNKNCGEGHSAGVRRDEGGVVRICTEKCEGIEISQDIVVDEEEIKITY